MYDKKAPDILFWTGKGFEKHSLDIPDLQYEKYSFIMYSTHDYDGKFYLLADDIPGNKVRDEGRCSFFAVADQVVNAPGVGTSTNIAYKGKRYLYEVDLSDYNVEQVLSYNNYLLEEKRSVRKRTGIDYNIVSSAFSPIAGYYLWKVCDKAGYIGTYLNREIDRKTFKVNKYTYMLSALSAIVAGILAFRRHSLNISVLGWMVFVFIFNISGLLTYIIVNWIKLAKCNVCSKKRSFESGLCPHCQSPLPVPQPNVTDIVKV